MKKTIALVLTLLSALALLTSCIHEDIGIVLNEDGTGKIAATVGVDKDTYNQLLGMGVDLLADAEKNSGETPFEYEYKGKTYIALSETTEYASYEELKQALLDMTYNTDELSEMTAYGTFENEDEAEIEEDAASEEDLPAEESASTAEEDDTEKTEMDNHIFKEVIIEERKSLFSKGLTFSATMNAFPEDGDSDTSITGSFLVTLSVELPYGIKKAGENAIVDGNKATFEIDDVSVENTFSVEAEKWSIWEWEGGFVRRTYHAKLVMTPVLIPDETAGYREEIGGTWVTRSGYGVDTSVIVAVQTDSGEIAGRLKVDAFYPEHGYSAEKTKSDRLELVGSEYAFRPLASSVSGARMHTIPIWFPDRPYSVKYSAYDLWCPAGMLSGRSHAKVSIDGDIYDDLYTQ